VSGDRARGVALYATAALLLAGGTTWWFRAAPRPAADPMIAQWQASAVRLLPDKADQDDADTVALAANSDHEMVSDVDPGTYQVSVVCVGGPDSRVRVSMDDTAIDSGLGLKCSDDSPTEQFDVGTSGRLRLHVSVGDVGPVVFRYILLHTAG
jgi:hypothetical protein